MLEGFIPFSVVTQESPSVTIAGVQSAESSLPPLLLLHGFPQTYHMWHTVAPQLVDKYNVIIPDIRGYGSSSKPDGVEAYAKSAMARDMVVLMDKLGYKDEQFYVCAHDRGARVAHKLCVDHPTRVKAAILLDICPTLAMYEATNLDFAKAYFHWFFLIQAAPMPELAILGAGQKFSELYFGARQGDSLTIFTEECFQIYSAALRDEPTVHAMCNDYRAAATVDMEESREDLKNGRLIKCPLRVIWGKKGVIEAMFDAVKEWQAVSDASIKVEGYAVESGHYVPEERPDDVVKAICEFLC
ncbi:hypothetical protein VHEMI05787 [[Torrubiella] hemipterigena]|uniref:AB hydrolase-1 domain-containing protein n=1 Tax=[Torrubiella] hemipterigena TaxID=1531966 RepID=A0A0A1THU3_9HYPO|nr:hypothetical protein VHEMI05787 [[Torrubiella] hemipterigena]